MQVPKKKIPPVDKHGRRRPSWIFLLIAFLQKPLSGFEWNFAIMFTDITVCKCLQTDGQADKRTPDPHKNSSGLCPEELMIREQYAKLSYIPFAYSTREIYADGSDMRTCSARKQLPVVALCERSAMRLYKPHYLFLCVCFQEDEEEFTNAMHALCLMVNATYAASQRYNFAIYNVTTGRYNYC